MHLIPTMAVNVFIELNKDVPALCSKPGCTVQEIRLSKTPALPPGTLLF